MRRMRSGGRSDSAPGRGGLRRRGGIRVYYRLDGTGEVIGDDSIEEVDGKVARVCLSGKALVFGTCCRELLEC